MRRTGEKGVRDYAIYHPRSGNPRRHPEYGFCEAVLIAKTEEEAKKIFKRFSDTSEDKELVLRFSPSGKKVKT